MGWYHFSICLQLFSFHKSNQLIQHFVIRTLVAAYIESEELRWILVNKVSPLSSNQDDMNYSHCIRVHQGSRRIRCLLLKWRTKVSSNLFIPTLWLTKIYANFTDSTFQMISIPQLTRTMKEKFLHYRRFFLLFY